MPEYLAPGVYVEEVSYRSKLIEGVPTSTTGYCGMTPFGPVQHPDGPSPTEPRLITSFTEFERVYGGIARILPDGGPERESYVGHAARAFFLNGGSRLYVSRVFVPGAGTGVAQLDRTAVAADPIVWHARWPGRYGNVVLVARPVRRGNSAYDHAEFGVVQVRGIRRGAVVEVTAPGADPPAAGTDVTSGVLRVVDLDLTSTDAGGQPKQLFVDETGTATAIAAGSVVKEVVVQVRVLAGEDRVDVYDDLATHPAQRRWIGKILEKDDPADEDAMVYLQSAEPDDPERAIALLVALQTLPQGERLSGGDDGQLALPDQGTHGRPCRPGPRVGQGDRARGARRGRRHRDRRAPRRRHLRRPDELRGRPARKPADRARGEAALPHRRRRHAGGQLDEPGAGVPREVRLDPRGDVPPLDRDPRPQRPARAGGAAASPAAARRPGSSRASTPATTSAGRSTRRPPTRSCALAIGFEALLNKGQQDVLNPEGINALRFFEGRGLPAVGRAHDERPTRSGRTSTCAATSRSSSTRSTRRRSGRCSSRTASGCGRTCRQTVEDFLLVQWQNGALLGDKPEKAYFVRCDRSTMTQNDLDNGRLVCPDRRRADCARPSS